MNRCETEGDLRAYLDRELPGPDRDRVAAHLAECGECDVRCRADLKRARSGSLPLSARWPTALRRRGRSRRRRRSGCGRDGWRRSGWRRVWRSCWRRRRRIRPRRRRWRLQKAEFVPLDNEPIDAGLVVRVSMGPDNVQADVIVSADGRARAYRLVSNQN